MGQNILSLLRQEHAKVVAQLDELQQQGLRDRKELFNRMKNNLLPHMAGEERVFYPELEGRGLRDLVSGSREEHTAIRTLMDRLNRTSMDDEENWLRAMLEVREAVESHVEREENVVFPEARKRMDAALLLQLGNRFEEAKGKAHLLPLR